MNNRQHKRATVL